MFIPPITKCFIKDVSLASARARLKCVESTSADLNRAWERLRENVALSKVIKS